MRRIEAIKPWHGWRGPHLPQRAVTPCLCYQSQGRARILYAGWWRWWVGVTVVMTERSEGDD